MSNVTANTPNLRKKLTIKEIDETFTIKSMDVLHPFFELDKKYTSITLKYNDPYYDSNKDSYLHIGVVIPSIDEKPYHIPNKAEWNGKLSQVILYCQMNVMPQILEAVAIHNSQQTPRDRLVCTISPFVPKFAKANRSHYDSNTGVHMSDKLYGRDCLKINVTLDLSDESCFDVYTLQLRDALRADAYCDFPSGCKVEVPGVREKSPNLYTTQNPLIQDPYAVFTVTFPTNIARFSLIYYRHALRWTLTSNYVLENSCFLRPTKEYVKIRLIHIPTEIDPCPNIREIMKCIDADAYYYCGGWTHTNNGVLALEMYCWLDTLLCIVEALGNYHTTGYTITGPMDMEDARAKLETPYRIIPV